MIHFDCDYMAGAHPDVLELLVKTNLQKTTGYGQDPYTLKAERIILDLCGLSKGRVWMMQGGTQTNKTVIDRLLSRNDGAVCTDIAHINVHEAGAIEADGHKVIPLRSTSGKLSGMQIKEYVESFYKDDTHIHMVRPAMVYISHPTELGTLYSLDELTEISRVCRQLHIPLYVDGARLAYSLGSPENDIALQDLARLADVFYIGGTKCGALFGEAVVTSRPELLPRFESVMKLQGALLAKGRLTAVQFIALFQNGLYERIGHEAVALAKRLKDGVLSRGYQTLIDSPTNQQFFIFPNTLVDSLLTDVGFEYWGPRGEFESAVRFVTDWTTTAEEVDILLEMIPRK